MMFDKPPITILGVGNTLLTDEGFGVHIINYLEAHYEFPPEVQLLDGGTMGMELLHYIGDAKYLLLVDAIHGGEAPGTVYSFKHEDLEHYFSEHISVHEVGIQDILRIRYVQGEPFVDAMVIGVEPEKLEIGLTMTPVVENTISQVVQGILEQLRQWNVEVTLRA